MNFRLTSWRENSDKKKMFTELWKGHSPDLLELCLVFLPIYLLMLVSLSLYLPDLKNSFLSNVEDEFQTSYCLWRDRNSLFCFLDKYLWYAVRYCITNSEIKCCSWGMKGECSWINNKTLDFIVKLQPCNCCVRLPLLLTGCILKNSCHGKKLINSMEF